jgi:PHP family Zn ribbon phosphoesterase
LAKTEEKVTENTGKSGIKWIADPQKNHPPFAKLVPLNEIIAETIGSPATSIKVKALFDELTKTFGSEFEVLLKTSVDDISKSFGEELAESILKVRNGNIFISPGYDGEYGVVKIEASEKKEDKKTQEEQLGLI